MVEKPQAFPATIETPLGPALIKSEDQWDEIVALAKYTARLRRNRVPGTNKVYVSALFIPEEEEND